ncbi:hypothetical protein MMC31_007104 [Peltigera leucophlebia]|nr:hypothetical protein [Peltigera leucophlebia]
MSSRPKKRQLTYTGHYKQSLRQSILAPRDCAVQRVLKTPKPASISKKRQETLTQIGYVVCPTSDELELTDGTKSDSDFEEAPHSRKRRKISSEPQIAVARRTRRSARQANQKRLNICEENDEETQTTKGTILVSEDEPNQDKEETQRRRKQGRISKPDGSATKQTRGSQRRVVETIPSNEGGSVQGHMLDTGEKIELSNTTPIPLPKTPQPSRRKEIPCSQSSADTNISTQSLRSVREVSRSPLKERSTNIGNLSTGALSGLNGNHRVPKLEIADSMEANFSVNQPATRPGLISKFSQKIEMTDENCWRFEADLNSSHEQPDSFQQVPDTPLVARGSGRKNIKFEVSDSDAEDEDEDHGDSEFTMGTDTKAAFGNFHVESETPLRYSTCLNDSGGPIELRHSFVDLKPSGIPSERPRYSYHDRASGARSSGSPTSRQLVRASGIAATPKQKEVLGFSQIGANSLIKCVTPEKSSSQCLGASDSETTPKQIYKDPSPSSRSPGRRLNGKPPMESLEHQLPESSGHSHRNMPQTPPSICSSPVFVSTELSPKPHKKGIFVLPHPRLALETESQFENAWHDYTPAPTLGDEQLDRESADEFQDPFILPPQKSENGSVPNLSDHTVLSLSKLSSQQQPTTIDITQSPPPTPPTPLYRRPSPSLSSSFEIHSQPSPILPSPKFHDSLSTTTTTITTNPLSSKGSKTADITQSPPRTKSPPKPISSSSPLDGVRTALDAYAGEWNGVRLTDSQLLPDSLINGSLVGPPMMMTLGGVDEEDLEYEEL